MSTQGRRRRRRRTRREDVEAGGKGKKTEGRFVFFFSFLGFLLFLGFFVKIFPSWRFRRNPDIRRWRGGRRTLWESPAGWMVGGGDDSLTWTERSSSGAAAGLAGHPAKRKQQKTTEITFFWFLLSSLSPSLCRLFAASCIRVWSLEFGDQTPLPPFPLLLLPRGGLGNGERDEKRWDGMSGGGGGGGGEGERASRRSW